MVWCSIFTSELQVAVFYVIFFVYNEISLIHIFFFFFFKLYGDPRDLPSFPTRPSSDLEGRRRRGKKRSATARAFIAATTTVAITGFGDGNPNARRAGASRSV